MKHNTADLLFAIAVRNRVADILEMKLPPNLDAEEQRQWRAKNVESETRVALKEVHMFADLIAEMAAQEPALAADPAPTAPDAAP